MRGLAWVLLAATLLTSGVGVAETIEETVAGNEVVVTYLETDETHNEVHTDNVDLVYHQEDVTNGATVNGEGGSVTLTRYSRDFAYHDGPTSVENNEDGVRVAAQGSLAGTNTDQRVTLYTNEVQYFFAPGDRGEADHGTVSWWSVSYGNGVAASENGAAGVGAGEFESPSRNPEPTFGLVAFASSNAFTSGSAAAGPVAVGHSAGGGQTTYVLDWNGVEAWATYFLARCANGQCQYDGNGANVCLVGLRPPFFFDCL